MKIEIDFELLESTKMSPDDFTYLYIIYRKGFNYLETLTLKPNLTTLQHNGYIKLGETPDQHIIRQEFIDLFSSNFDQMFAELIGTYPMKVNTKTRGVRILHAKDPDAKSNEKAKNRYKKIIGNKVYKHRHIMNCLDKQLSIERYNLAYMQNLETWINNHTWEKYENLDENDTKDTATRITRAL
jgi:hypothetical protein|tara:strand:- start:1596 stop:2147 length:552 start_codon:yes stop_codon:yes gene_type:complete